MKKRVCMFFVCCLVAPWAGATSVVVMLEKDRIILAADTRRSDLTESSGLSRSHDDYCKITKLGRFAFAAAGSPDYKRSDPSDPVGDWNVGDDARTSYRLHPNNLVEMADDWKTRVIGRFANLYRFHPRLVSQAARENDGDILLVGLFAGWDNGRPALAAVAILLNYAPFALSSMLTPIGGFRNMIYERPEPYTTNGSTRQLINGDSELGKATAKKWAVMAQRFPESQRDWRWIEFLIQSTNAYDKGVGKDVDVLDIRASRSSWLQRKACVAQKST